MAKFYNTTRGPIAVSLSSGNQLSIPPKTWIEIDPADEGSAMLVPMVRKGFLVRSSVDAVKPGPTPEPAPAPAPVVAAPVLPPVLPVLDEKPLQDEKPIGKKHEAKSTSVEK